MTRELFSAGIRAGRTAVSALDPEEWQGPFREGGVVPGFDIREVLGAKGTRSMDRATGLAVAAVGTLLNKETRLERSPNDAVGLVLGTNMGSAQSIMDFTRDSLTQEKPYYVDPARFPNTVMNCAAGQCAIWYGLRGPNTTMACGHVTGLAALNYAARLQRCGYASAMLFGAVEELSMQREWLDWHAREKGSPVLPLGEGCVVFLLEPLSVALEHGRQPTAELLALEMGAFGTAAALPDALATCLRRALARADLRTADVWGVAPSALGGWLGEHERRAITAVLGKDVLEVRTTELLGDTSAASAAFQVAALLALADGSDLDNRIAAVTSVDRDGVFGCALFRLRSVGA